MTSSRFETTLSIVGGGEPLVVVHGGPGLDHRYLIEWLLPLRGRRTLVFYDQVGCGLDATPPERITAEQNVAQLEELLLTIDAPHYDVVAHSWGAYLVYQALLRERAPRMRSLVLVSPVGLTRERFDQSGVRLIERIPDNVLAEVERLDAEGADGARVMQLLAPFYQADSEHPVSLSFPTYRSLTFNRVVETLGDYDCRAVSSHLPQRTLRMYGDQDIELPRDTDELLDYSELRVFPRAGHFAFAEQHEQFIQELTLFLDQSGDD